MYKIASSYGSTREYRVPDFILIFKFFKKIFLFTLTGSQTNFFLNIYLFTWLHQVLFTELGIFSLHWSMRDL